MNLKFLKKSKEKIFLSILGTAFLCFSPLRSEAYGLTEIFDADYYATRYEDIQAVFGNNTDALCQ